jgi:hypothetical protein
MAKYINDNKKKKSYLNSSSFIDRYLKRTHSDNLRKNDVKNINQIIIEENNKSNNGNNLNSL